MEPVYRACATADSGQKTDSFLAKVKAFFRCIPKRTRKPPKIKQKSTTCFYISVVLVGIFFIMSFSGFCIMWFTDMYLDSIMNELTLKEGSTVFEAWSKPPIKPLICGHVFNYTNIDEFARGIDDKIKVEEVGPYCYRETQEKVGIVFNNDSTVTYSDLRKHVFEPTKSKGSMDDILIVPNMALISVIGMSKNLMFPARMAIASMLRYGLKYSHSVIKVRAHDYFFGYDDDLVEFLTRIGEHLNQKIPFEKFGLLTTRATFSDETITVDTGMDDLNKIGVVTEVNGEPELGVWPDYECNRIDGSDGAFFPRNIINDSATLYLFHKDLCRRMPFIFDKEVEFQDGVMASRFHAAPTVYDTNGTCYCPPSGCAPSGIFDLSPCSKGAPIMMSHPHFLYADPSISKRFEGLHPDPEKHEFYIDINRLLGFTLGTVSRLQLNIKVDKTSGFSTMLKEFPNGIILPIVWIQVSAERLPPDLFKFIYHSSITVRQLQVILRWSTLVGTLLSIILMIQLWRIYSQRRRENRIKTQNLHEIKPIGPKNKSVIIT